jgi:hypothetical protein
MDEASSRSVKVTEVAGVMTTSAGGRTARAILMRVSEIPVDKSPDSSEDKRAFPAIKALLQIKLIKSHQRNRWIVEIFCSIKLPKV